MLLYNDTEADEAASNFYCLEIVLPSALNITSWSQINQGGFIVALDMCLTLFSVFFNIMVISSMRDKEEFLESNYNLLLVNLCCSNLICAIFTKSISVVHIGYAVAAAVTESHIAFCLIYTFSYRLSWAVLPWSLVLLSWIPIIKRINLLKEHFKSNESVAGSEKDLTTIMSGRGFTYSKHGLLSANLIVKEENPIPEEKVFMGPKVLDKCMVGCVWFIAFIYACLSEQILSKEVDIPCSISDSLQSVFGVSSIIISIIIPVIIGPILSLVVLLLLSAVFLVTGVKSCKESQLEDRRNICCNMLLTIIFIPTYTTSMIISELYFPIPDNIFHFILLKFIIGVSHQLLGPMAILLSQTDIRNNVVQVYRKGGTSQNTTMEMTYEELQRNLGLGVDIG